MKFILRLCLLLVPGFIGYGQTPKLVFDTYPENKESNIVHMVDADDIFYLSVRGCKDAGTWDCKSGLWKIEKESEESDLIYDFTEISYAGMVPEKLTYTPKGTLLFIMRENEKKFSLWISKGEEENTKRIFEFPDSIDNRFRISDLLVLGKNVYFSTRNEMVFRIWKMNIKKETVVQIKVKELNSIKNYNAYPYIEKIGNTLYFFDYRNKEFNTDIIWYLTKKHRFFKWIYRGRFLYNNRRNPEHRLLLIDKETKEKSVHYLNGYPPFIIKAPNFIQQFCDESENNFFNFSSIDGVHFYRDTAHGRVDRQLWRNDGTDEGTYPLTDISFTDEELGAYAKRWDPEEGEYYNDETRKYEPVSGMESDVYIYYKSEGILYFKSKSYASEELWRTDGTKEGTWMIDKVKIRRTNDVDSSFEGLRLENGTLYYTLLVVDEPSELWKLELGAIKPKLVSRLSVKKHSSMGWGCGNAAPDNTVYLGDDFIADFENPDYLSDLTVDKILGLTESFQYENKLYFIGDVSWGGSNLYVIKLPENEIMENNVEDSVDFEFLEVKLEDIINIFPNPCSHYLNFYLSEALSGGTTVELLTMNGAKVSKHEFQDLGEGNQKISTTGLADGIYLLRITNKNKRIPLVEKVVVKNR